MLDVACGTGLNFPLLRGNIGPDGLLVGLDFSSGMLAKARRKVERAGWQNVQLIQADARTVSAEFLSKHDVPAVDRVLCTLGLSVVPDWERDVSRMSWAPLKEEAVAYERETFILGNVFVAAGRKPSGTQARHIEE